MPDRKAPGNPRPDHLTPEELECVEEIPRWHLNFLLKMPIGSIGRPGEELTSIEKVRAAIQAMYSPPLGEARGYYDLAVSNMAEHSPIYQVVNLMFPLEGFAPERERLARRLVQAANVATEEEVRQIDTEELEKMAARNLSLSGLSHWIDQKPYFTDYLTLSTEKIWNKYMEESQAHKQRYRDILEQALFGEADNAEQERATLQAFHNEQNQNTVRPSTLEKEAERIAIYEEVVGKSPGYGSETALIEEAASRAKCSPNSIRRAIKRKK